MHQTLVQSAWLPRVIHRVGRGKRMRTLIFGLPLFGLLPAVCFLASWFDDTFYLEQRNGGRGLLEHPAFWALFLSGPVLCLLLFSLFRRMSKVIEIYCSGALDTGNEKAQDCRERVLDLLTCRTPALKVVFGTMMLCGALSLLANIQNTRVAPAVYGHDVWDSADHMLGFLAAKAFLAFAWIYLFPLVTYLALAASASILTIVDALAAVDEIHFRPFEPDGCGGYRPLGQAMLSVLYLNIPFALVVAADIYAHRIAYLTIALAVALLAVTTLAEVFVPFVRLHSLLAAGKAARLRELSDLIARQEIAVRRPQGFYSPKASAFLSVLAIAELYRQVKAVRTWPYLPVDRLKWITPLLPIGFGVLRLILLR